MISKTSLVKILFSYACLSGYSSCNLITDSECIQHCTTGYSDPSVSSNQRTYSCPAGQFNGTILNCVPDVCGIGTIPTGLAYSSCDLLTDSQCTQSCTAGYSDATVANNQQTYSCPSGTFNGVVLNCIPNDCHQPVPTGQ